MGSDTNHSVAVIVPCFRVKDTVIQVVTEALRFADAVYCVDDACPEQSGKLVESTFDDPRVKVHFSTRNGGVGSAVKIGYKAALGDGYRILIKIDGDGQMDPSLIPLFTGPINAGVADYCKGNRFYELGFLKGMPALRILGNSMLSLIAKLSSGYWKLLDPTNGYTAIHAGVLGQLPLDKVHDRYFFESDLLFRLYISRAVVRDIPMRARYGNEVSNLRISRQVLPFLFGHLKNFFKRIFYTYFLRDFNIATLQLIVGLMLGLFGVVFGVSAWHQSIQSGIPASAGTVMLAGLPSIVSVQLLLSFLNYDIQNLPSHSLCGTLDADRQD